MPNLKLYDSYLKKQVEVVPAYKSSLKIYSCGPTVYNYQTIGNMRAVWLPDTVSKVLKMLGLKASWVLNITDVGHLVGDGDKGGDKIESKARKEHKKAQEIVNFYTDDFKKQCASLNFCLPEYKMNPKATDYIQEQMLIALFLLKKNLAYLAKDGIYFDWPKARDIFLKNPQKLSKQLKIILEIQEKSRKGSSTKFTGRNIKSSNKNFGDFALWKFVQPESLQKWKFEDFEIVKQFIASFPLKGFDQDFDQFNQFDQKELQAKWGCPGWHSECVAMINSILGENADLTSKIQLEDIRSTFDVKNLQKHLPW